MTGFATQGDLVAHSAGLGKDRPPIGKVFFSSRKMIFRSADKVPCCGSGEFSKKCTFPKYNRALPGSFRSGGRFASKRLVVGVVRGEGVSLVISLINREETGSCHDSARWIAFWMRVKPGVPAYPPRFLLSTEQGNSWMGAGDIFHENRESLT